MNGKEQNFLKEAESLIETGRFMDAEAFVIQKQLEYPDSSIWLEYELGPRQKIPHEIRASSITYNHRNDWQKFKKILDDNHLSYFVHLTDKSNLESIIKHRGLYSKQAMEHLGIRPNKFISDDLSRDLDRNHGIYDYIHLSIKKAPMMYLAEKQQDVELIELLIDSRIIYAEETKFSNKNATDSSANVGFDFNNFKKINLQIANGEGRWKTEEEKKLFQAEILVERYIPLKLIYMKKI